MAALRTAAAEAAELGTAAAAGEAGRAAAAPCRQQVAAVAFGLGWDVESAGQQVAADPQVVVGQTGVDPAADQLAAAVQLVAVDLVADHQQR